MLNKAGWVSSAGFPIQHRALSNTKSKANIRTEYQFIVRANTTRNQSGRVQSELITLFKLWTDEIKSINGLNAQILCFLNSFSAREIQEYTANEHINKIYICSIKAPAITYSKARGTASIQTYQPYITSFTLHLSLQGRISWQVDSTFQKPIKILQNAKAFWIQRKT